MQMASASARQSSRDADTVQRIERARRLMHDRYADRLDLERIARGASLSAHHFHRLFRRHTGETPHDYLTRRRVDRARELLTTTDRSVTDVCFDVGFESLGSFSTLFRRHTGEPPSRFRALMMQSLGVAAPAPLLAPIPACFLRAFARQL
jgi:transcriptional regulator GlxA family with amidase domain